MLHGWNIRQKLRVGIALLLVAVSTLAIGGFTNAYAFRGLVRSISRRATEIPMSVSLAQHVSALRATVPNHELAEIDLTDYPEEHPIGGLLSLEFEQHLKHVRQSLHRYRERLEDNAQETGQIGDIRHELQTVGEMESVLARIAGLKPDSQTNWLLSDPRQREELRSEVEHLNQMAETLPTYLQERMFALQGDVRGHYRFWIILTWFTSLSAGALLILLGQLFYRWVFQPLDQLIVGSRRVASGEFSHRIHLHSGDEMEELAHAMNHMTERFQQIRDDLDQQVQQRTREVIRGEQLASVGFLAAGVAHEINNPLASIALCAESLEQQLPEWLESVGARHSGDWDSTDEPLNDLTAGLDGDQAAEADPFRSLVQDYLRMIQDEAFRCKAITERLLDFSRLGDLEKHPTDLDELVQGVVDMVRHVGNYKHKQVEFHATGPIVAPVNAQEIKQVVLNLITNGLESLDPGGTVRIRLTSQRQQAVLEVSDNGCGMTDEIKAHLFEPFFTRRRDGQGTGLGMSISYRIINEHGGTIDVHSDGPGQGSRITVRLPLENANKEQRHRYQAA